MTRIDEPDDFVIHALMLHPASGRLGFGSIVPPQVRRQCSGRTWDKIGIGVILLITVIAAAVLYAR